MNRCTSPIPALPRRTVLPALIATLIFFLAVFQVQAQPAADSCLHTEWGIPKGTYIEKFCPDLETRKSCLTDVVNYDEASDLLYVNYYRQGHLYSLEIIRPCAYVEAGFDLYPIIANYEEAPELWVYAEGATDRKHQVINYRENSLEDPFLHRLTTRGQVGNSCTLKYYPDHDFLVGSCESVLKKSVFVMVSHFREKTARLVQSEMGSLSESIANQYAIANLDGNIRLQFCAEDTQCQTKREAYATTTSESCLERGMAAVNIQDRWFCHDKTVDKGYIKIADCKKKKLAVDSAEGLLIAECTSGKIRYLPNPAECLKAGLEFSRVKGSGELLGCELSKAEGVAVESAQPSEDETEEEAGQDTEKETRQGTEHETGLEPEQETQAGLETEQGAEQEEGLKPEAELEPERETGLEKETGLETEQETELEPEHEPETDNTFDRQPDSIQNNSSTEDSLRDEL